jgi:hypothetical protein
VVPDASIVVTRSIARDPSTVMSTARDFVAILLDTKKTRTSQSALMPMRRHSYRQLPIFIPRRMKDKASETENEVSGAAHQQQQQQQHHEQHHLDLSGEAAGVMRGVSRSIGRGPWIGRLPARPSPSSVGRGILRKRLPVRHVARVSDRVATGLDLYTSALEASTESPETVKTSASTRRKEWILRARSFGWSLFRNTLLGMAVFESYGYVVSSLSPAAAPAAAGGGGGERNDQEMHDSRVSRLNNTDLDAHDDHVDDDDDDDDGSVLFGEPDEYSRASLPSHFFAGSLAGSIHGLASTLMEGNPTSRSTVRYLSWNTLHHSVAHSMLFGSYESIKRGMFHLTGDDEHSVSISRAYHVLTFSVAGGLAGQIQHMASHYLEGGLGLANETLQVNWQPALRTAPAIRPLLWAFPPSAIGFVAFEYGKHFVS